MGHCSNAGDLSSEPVYLPLPKGLEDNEQASIITGACTPPPGLTLSVSRHSSEELVTPYHSEAGTILAAACRSGGSSAWTSPAVVAKAPMAEDMGGHLPHLYGNMWGCSGSTQVPSDIAACWSPADCFDNGDTPAAFEMAALGQDLCRSLGSSGGGRARGGKASGSIRWWTKPDLPLLCPLTRFPVTLLPYPPFKLRVDPQRSSPHRLVDGKFLAMHLIVTGRFFACGRELHQSDINALDDFVHRCKLGPYRPGRALALAKEVADVQTAPERRVKAAQELQSFTTSTRAELGKLRRIQENRLLQLNKTGSSLHRGRLSSGSSSASTSTRASASDSPKSQF
eukprot:CAMPEP_0115399626 /NCGR_PEP_ID=MMETSP0271-20121206/14934_1 /TAXON_ID=71861 /ORGANISM="Scrippsiella trochoidea, Strain CCMP3099" /LENGTH=339 /DNA_ID=CAMNT_0002823445 /DNA_START=14 /DNA_END=1033 /DNA_ORIENTATION=-